MICPNCSCKNCSPEKKRTLTQNRALHKYFELLAQALNDAGYDMKKTIRKDIDISWSPITIKEYLWKPFLKGYKLKTSTTQMTTKDIDKIYDMVNKVVGERTGVFVGFPSIEQLMLEEQSKKI